MSQLPNDTDLQFPQVFVMTASAGSGKTYMLSRRYVQFLLSEKIKGNNLQSILAITFTNLAAKEMKQRILRLVKEAAIGNREIINQFSELIALPEEQISLHSSRLVDDILHNYSDFNVRTIDSFMSTVFKASSLEFGYQPDVDITLDPDVLIGETFEEFSRTLKEGSDDARFIDELISLIEENERGQSSYLWNPFSKILREVRELHSQLGKHAADPQSIQSEKRKRELSKKIMELSAHVRKDFDDTNLPVHPYFSNDINRLLQGDILTVAAKKEWTNYISVSKLSKDQKDEYERSKKKLFRPVNKLNKHMKEYAEVYARGYYEPFIRAVRLVDETFKEIKRIEGTVVLDDVNKTLAGYLVNADIPQVYIKLGETINHFMFDEFQDTSPIQWYNLQPLVENSLSTIGSLFVVGDTKQSIYGFRGADWRIMKELETNPHYFPSAYHQVLPLEINYRSAEALVDFVAEVFVKKTKEIGYNDYANESGLLDCAQTVPDDKKGKGYAEVKFIQRTDDEESVLQEQRTYIVDTVNDCLQRGFSYKDIAIITPANADVVQVSSWLNEAGLPFVSHSTLDIRKRKIVGELIAFLGFLDSPVDNLSFATSVLGDLFSGVMHNEKVRKADLHALFSSGKGSYYYLKFREAFPSLWKHYFESLFSRVGYLPLYDLVSETLKTLSVFASFPEEETALIKFLECVKNFENTGSNSIKDFLTYSLDESNRDEWSIDVPTNVEAVRVMTIHKSKGLGFPVVCALFKDRIPKNRGPIIEETGDTIAMLKITDGLALRNEELAKLYDQKNRELVIDDLNKLYVALTRAEEEMYVVSIVAKDKKSKSKDEEEKKIPSMLFPTIPFGKKSKRIKVAQTEDAKAAIAEYRNDPSSLPVSSYQKIGLIETMRGDFVHNVLVKIDFLPIEFEKLLVSAIEEVKKEHSASFDTDEISTILRSFLSFPEIAQYFMNDDLRFTSVLREQDFVTSSGQLFRMDRVVIGENEAAVVDFKTGSDEMNEKYQEQVRNYITILKDVYPSKTITGALLYVDMRKVVPVV